MREYDEIFSTHIFHVHIRAALMMSRILSPDQQSLSKKWTPSDHSSSTSLRCINASQKSEVGKRDKRTFIYTIFRRSRSIATTTTDGNGSKEDAKFLRCYSIPDKSSSSSLFHPSMASCSSSLDTSREKKKKRAEMR